jgi:hypothetical protein
MRAIIIDDKDARALLDKMKLESGNFGYHQYYRLAEKTGPITTQEVDQLVQEVFRHFNYHLVGWLVDQGVKLH